MQNYKEVIVTLEKIRWVNQGIHEYKGLTVSVSHFSGNTGKYSVLHLHKTFKSLKSTYKWIDDITDIIR